MLIYLKSSPDLENNSTCWDLKNKAKDHTLKL